MLTFMLSESSEILSVAQRNLFKQDMGESFPIPMSYPENGRSMMEQSLHAFQFVKDCALSEKSFWVPTHSEFYINAAIFLILKGSISCNQVRAMYYSKTSDEGIPLSFDSKGRCEPWPAGFMAENTNLCHVIANLRRNS